MAAPEKKSLEVFWHEVDQALEKDGFSAAFYGEVVDRRGYTVEDAVDCILADRDDWGLPRDEPTREEIA